MRDGMAAKLKLQSFQISAPRKRGEGLRLGTVRFLPRGVRKEDYAKLDYFDVWFPTLAPSAELVKWARSRENWPDEFARYGERYRREMINNTASRQAIKLLANLAVRTPVAIGCYCVDARHCHRSILRELIEEAASNDNWPG